MALLLEGTDFTWMAVKTNFEFKNRRRKPALLAAPLIASNRINFATLQIFLQFFFNTKSPRVFPKISFQPSRLVQGNTVK